MRFYRATDTVKFFGGDIFLTEAQIAGRKLSLEVGAKGKCKILKEVQFKVGEVIGLDEVPKIFAKTLRPVEEKKIDAKS